MDNVASATDELTSSAASIPPLASVTPPREGKDLIDASRPFAEENRLRSWAHVVETLGVLAFFVVAAGTAPWLSLRVLAGVIAGLVIVRGFILYHDYQHGALLRGSKLAKVLFDVYGVYVLTPPSVWKQTHNYHHAHTAKIVGSHIGSYPVVTVEMWQKLSPVERRGYKLMRHPLVMVLGYFTIFAWGMCVSPYLRDKRKHRMAPVVLALHALAVAAVVWAFGWQVALTAHVLPLAVSFATGAYLFYAQHNFPGMHIEPRETWSYTRAALESSSYMECGPVMSWLTGNIGYHHVHHLNPSIPFYRLPEAMAKIPELRDPVKTTLRPRDVIACLKLKLWDPQRGEMVPFPAE